jgi:hypothetical protein
MAEVPVGPRPRSPTSPPGTKAFGLRGWDTIWPRLDGMVQKRIIAAMELSRMHCPGFNNWLLFSAMIEAFLCRAGVFWDRVRVDYALRQTEQFYAGDGVYSDGPFFHHDYYNSYVIQPMLAEILETVSRVDSRWDFFGEAVRERIQRYAAVQERLIGPDGSFPPLGRSLAYRGGAFQLLAQAAWNEDLPADLAPAQVRCALTAVLRRTLDTAGTFDENGWLRIGLAGNQPGLGEVYISTGSLYLCSGIFLPLGLSPKSEFWKAPPKDWTSRLIWSGKDHAADHAIVDRKFEQMGWR